MPSVTQVDTTIHQYDVSTNKPSNGPQAPSHNNVEHGTKTGVGSVIDAYSNDVSPVNTSFFDGLVNSGRLNDVEKIQNQKEQASTAFQEARLKLMHQNLGSGPESAEVRNKTLKKVALDVLI